MTAQPNSNQQQQANAANAKATATAAPKKDERGTPSTSQFLTNAVQALVGLKAKVEADQKELAELRAFKKRVEGAK